MRVEMYWKMTIIMSIVLIVGLIQGGHSVNAQSFVDMVQGIETVSPDAKPLQSVESVSVQLSPEVAQALETLAQNTKLLDPQGVLKSFRDGNATARVIVNLHEPLGANAERNFAELASRQQLQADVQVAQERVLTALPSADVQITQRFTYIFGFAAEVTVQGLQAILNHPDVVSVNEDLILYAHLNQGIPLMSGTTPRSSYNGTGMSIAICDTGIDYTHPRLGGGGFPNSKVIGGYDVGDGDANPMDAAGHGTSCAGIAAGNLGTVGDYIGGVAYNAKLYAIKISTGSTGSASSSAMIAGWEWAITHQNDDPSNPIRIISTSFGGDRSTSQCDTAVPAMTTAAANAVAAGITVFVSSGNEGYCNATAWPACISHVISVGAVYDANIGQNPPSGYVGCIGSDSCAGYTCTVCGIDPVSSLYKKCYSDAITAADRVTTYSNSASFLTLFAPSNNAYTTDIVGSGGYSTGDYTSSFGGTSAACPYAAGAAAVLQSAAKAKTGSYLTPAQVKSYLTTYGNLVTDTKVAITKPRINLTNAVNALPGSSGNSYLLWTQGGSSSTGFNSQFNGDATGWEAHSGSWSIASSAYLYTPGLTNYWSSVSYNATYTALDYQALLWRYGCEGCANALFIRGTPTPLYGSNYGWNKWYEFAYVRSGEYSVWKFDNGSWTALQSWTSTSSINPGDAWNTLRVYASGSYFYFYINGILVWSGSDTSFSSGRVGIGMYSDGTTGDALYVDWATLSVPGSKSEEHPAISAEQQALNAAANASPTGSPESSSDSGKK